MDASHLSSWRVPGVPTLSPDGRTAVVAVTRPDLDADEYTAVLWRVPTDGTASPRQLTHGWRDAEPRWSPDGQHLAFLRATRDPATGTVGRPQLWVMPVDGGEPCRLTDHPLGVAAPVWHPDGTRLAYTARVPEPGRYGTDERVPAHAEPPRRITRLRYRVDDLGFVCDRPAHVHVVPVDGGDPVQVTTGDTDHAQVDWSPDGERLTFVAARHARAGDDLRADVWVCRPDGADVRALTHGGLAAEQPRFTPDGGAVVFRAVALGDDDRRAVCRNQGVWTVPLGDGDPRRLTDPEWHHVPPRIGMTAPATDGVYVTVEHRGEVRLLRLPYDGGPAQPVVAGPRQVLGFATAGGVTVVSYTDSQRPGEVARVEPVGQADGAPGGAEQPLTTLTAFNADWGTDIPVRPPVEFTAEAPDGYPVHGWVVAPAGEGPHPVILMVHGGPFFQYGWGLFDEAQVAAGAGYAVVLGNPRGSSGYGQAHGEAVRGDVGAASAADLLSLLDAALARDPALDATRVGVMGGSHGGFMTTWLAAHHGDRFRAAISERAVNAIDSFTGSSDIGWFFAADMYGDDLAGQARQSPLTYADRIDLPMLIIHSEQDWRCPVEQAQRLFVALKRREVPVELLLFPGEGHELTRTGRPRHRVARFAAVLDWWRRHLR